VAEIFSKNKVAATTAIQTAASVDNMLLIRDKSDPSKSSFFIGTVLPDTAYYTVNGKHEKFAEKPAKGGHPVDDVPQLPAYCDHGGFRN